MDLIYTDKDMVDVGVLVDYTLDIAYGSDENDFELQLYTADKLLPDGTFIYIEDTEYAGIIDSVDIDTSSELVTYKGRCLSGILNSHIIYGTFEGYMTDIINEILHICRLDTICSVMTSDGWDAPYIDSVFVDNKPVYDFIRSLAAHYYTKIMIKFSEGKIIISCTDIADYSSEEEFDNTQVSFSAGLKYNDVNHLICVATSNNDVYRIHLFLNEFGVLQPYATVADPIKDDDYILDETNIAIEGIKEITEILNLSISEVENYIMIKKKPSDWDDKYFNYFYKTTDDSGEVRFENIEQVTKTTYLPIYSPPVDWDSTWSNYYYFDKSSGEFESASNMDLAVYTKLSSKPANWELTWKSYYTKSDSYTKVTDKDHTRTDYYYVDAQGNYTPLGAYSPDNKELWETNLYVKKTEYKSVEATNTEQYIRVNKCPSNWSESYSSYFIKNSRGGFDKVSSTTKESYTLIKTKPKDWDSRYASYFEKKIDGQTISYNAVSGISYQAKAVMKYKPDDWNSNWYNYYLYNSSGKFVQAKNIISLYYPYTIGGVIPDWKPNKYFQMVNKTKAPKWVKNKYYTKITSNVAPTWKTNVYYGKFSTSVSPVWKSETYYSLTLKEYPAFIPGGFYEKGEVITPIDFSDGIYYNKYIDHYKSLVDEGIEKFKSIYSSGDISIELVSDIEYDIGDYVEAIDNVSGIVTRQPIKKKIIKIDSTNSMSIDYEVGEENV